MDKKLQKTLERERSLNWLYVQNHLIYNSKAGEFYRAFNNCSVFRPFSHYHNKAGYVLIKLVGQFFYASRLAWRFHYGEWPPMRVIHLNGDKDDLRIANLALEDPLM